MSGARNRKASYANECECAGVAREGRRQFKQAAILDLPQAQGAAGDKTREQATRDYNHHAHDAWL